jgi:DNA-binding CsgD family transcriptional regulator
MMGEARVTRFTFNGREYVVVSLAHAGAACGSLTAAERDVVQRVVDGRSNAEIARARGTAVSTVANQLASIFRKLGVGSRFELIAGLRDEGSR